MASREIVLRAEVPNDRLAADAGGLGDRVEGHLVVGPVEPGRVARLQDALPGLLDHLAPLRHAVGPGHVHVTLCNTDIFV